MAKAMELRRARLEWWICPERYKTNDLMSECHMILMHWPHGANSALTVGRPEFITKPGRNCRLPLLYRMSSRTILTDARVDRSRVSDIVLMVHLGISPALNSRKRTLLDGGAAGWDLLVKIGDRPVH